MVRAVKVFMMARVAQVVPMVQVIRLVRVVQVVWSGSKSGWILILLAFDAAQSSLIPTRTGCAVQRHKIF